MFNPLELLELADLVAWLGGGKREPVKTPKWKPVVGGYMFGLVGAALGAKLASKLAAGDRTGYVLMAIAGFIGFVAFLKGWCRVFGGYMRDQKRD